MGYSRLADWRFSRGAASTLTRTVWIFEDEPAVGQLLVDLVAGEGHSPRLCTTLTPPGPPAPALAIFDLRMAVGRGMSVADALALLRSQPGAERLPVLVMTADLLLVRELARELAQQDNVAILPKPFALDALLDVTRAMIQVASGGRDEVLLSEVAVLLADPSARYVAANRRALDLLGYSIDELRALNVRDVVVSPERFVDEWDRYRAERYWSGRASVRRRDGNVIGVRVTASIVESGDQSLHVAWLRPEG
jgi:PAS domain S-box-containing protein